jgi:hypothetical protein
VSFLSKNYVKFLKFDLVHVYWHINILVIYLLFILLQIQNDFSKQYPLTEDNLFNKWTTICQKICEYAAAMKRSFSTIGISETAASGKTPKLLNKNCVI